MAKILIVDDEPSFCELLKTLLKSHGHEALTAYTGQDALDSFMQCRPHFTLLDLRMPEMDGLEVLKKIRAVDPKAAVMILTAWGTDEMEQQAMKKYVVGFALGLGMGIAVTALAVSPLISGENGYLEGWSVIVKHRTACKSPFLRLADREIECVS